MTPEEAMNAANAALIKIGAGATNTQAASTLAAGILISEAIREGLAPKPLEFEFDLSGNTPRLVEPESSASGE